MLKNVQGYCSFFHERHTYVGPITWSEYTNRVQWKLKNRKCNLLTANILCSSKSRWFKAPRYTYGTEKEKKVHRFTNNLQGLQKVMEDDFSWKIVPWNALLFEKTLKQLSILVVKNYGFILNTCHDTVKRGWVFPVIFSRLRWLIEPKFSQVCYFLYQLWYTKCGPLDNTVYRKCPMAVTTTFYGCLTVFFF